MAVVVSKDTIRSGRTVGVSLGTVMIASTGVLGRSGERVLMSKIPRSKMFEAYEPSRPPALQLGSDLLQLQ